MKVDLFFTPHEVNEEKLKDHTAVVVDVLRASTTICAALAAGAKEVIPAESTAAAIQLAGNLSRDAILLCGEREGKLVEGFDLGNSPLQYTPALVKGRTLIFGSTNGSPTIVKTRLARRTYICGLVNVGAVVEALSENDDPIDILCAGKLSQFALEDAVCAGILIHDLQEQTDSDMILNDAASASLILFDRYRDLIPSVVMDSHHGRYLAEIGMQADLPFCSDLNRIPLLPVYHEGKITIPREDVRSPKSGKGYSR